MFTRSLADGAVLVVIFIGLFVELAFHDDEVGAACLLGVTDQNLDVFGYRSYDTSLFAAKWKARYKAKIDAWASEFLPAATWSDPNSAYIAFQTTPENAVAFKLRFAENFAEGDA